MKKTLILWISMFLAIFIVSGCQKTPVEPVVGNKQESVEQKVSAAPPEAKPTENADRLKKMVDTGNENITVTLDAIIQKPETKKFPVVKIETRDFTQEEADKIIRALFGDQTLYKPWETTKAEYEPQIIRLRQIVSDPDSTEDEREMARLQLEFYERQYQKAPETVKKEPADTEFVTVDPKDQVQYADGHEYTSEGDEYQVIDVWAVEGDMRLCLSIVNAYHGANSWMMYSKDASRNFVGYQKYETTIKKDRTNSGFQLEEAKKTADEAMAEMGIDLEMTASGLISYVKANGTGSAGMEEIESAPLQAYAFYYTRHINGVPVTYDTEISGGALDEYDRAVYYEMASLTVDETGVRFMEYRAPYNVLETVEDNAKIIGMGEAVDIFEKQMKFKYEAAGPESVFDINIHSIVFGLSRIKSGDGGLLLVPTWDFLGNIIYRPEESSQLLNPPSKTNYESISPVYSILTINAIDGTVIDKRKGY
jgi:hypothetical protein